MMQHYSNRISIAFPDEGAVVASACVVDRHVHSSMVEDGGKQVGDASEAIEQIHSCTDWHDAGQIPHIP